jgi:hypothetical protein
VILQTVVSLFCSIHGSKIFNASLNPSSESLKATASLSTQTLCSTVSALTIQIVNDDAANLRPSRFAAASILAIFHILIANLFDHNIDSITSRCVIANSE